MMVEAEATENVIELVEGGAQAPTESVVAEGLEAAKPFIAALCTAQQELADDGRQTDRLTTRPSPITATTSTTRWPRWPPTSCPPR